MSTTKLPPGLPISYELAAYIAEAAIDLYRECLTYTGGDEERAEADAVQTVAEGASTPTDPIAET